MITRFAPSPTGPLHLGHAFSAFQVWDLAQRLDGQVLLRIEDTDSTRCRSHHKDAICDDLTWLGLTWPKSVRTQSQHYDDYAAILDQLTECGLLYPCDCTRRQIKDAGATTGWDGLVYPGTCRTKPMSQAAPTDALRLNLSKALDSIKTPMTFTEIGPIHPGKHVVDPEQVLKNIGDPILRRKETGDPAYHLASPHDDALQSVTHVVRGMDLWRATYLHVVLQTLMGWPTPTYFHHDLIRDESGQRLAKISNSEALSVYRNAGHNVADLRALIGLHD
ncbi:tRNA glutamyl-Q(34) synthetase GluQRS [Aestuariibius sp. HNIBRBA575]|uniref:tRNA glutamyl-Q(34) synthetase GluQRS n=1 Tax=Aestuariibius sp. HNIBRBA575 TaxID=3233343 RepID=UPI0034A20E42